MTDSSGSRHGKRSACLGSVTSNGTAAPPAWARALGRLTALDVSDAVALSPVTMAGLLRACGALRWLRATGCRALAAAASKAGFSSSSGDGDPSPSLLQLLQAPPGAAAPVQPAPGSQLPSLHELAAGWGFSQGVIAALVDASPFLTRLELGLGAEATGGLMRRVAARCPHMQDLTLRLVSVDTEGAGAGFVAGGWRLGVGTKGWGLGTGDWGLGTGDWGLESGAWGLGTGDCGLVACTTHAVHWNFPTLGRPLTPLRPQPCPQARPPCCGAVQSCGPCACSTARTR